MEPNLHDWDEEARSREERINAAHRAAVDEIARPLLYDTDCIEEACTECTDDEWRGVVLWMSVAFERLDSEYGVRNHNIENIAESLMPAMRRIVERKHFGGE
jgi:hypothetical protein